MTGSFSVRELRSDDRSLLLAATLGNLNWQEARFTEQEILERSEFRHYLDVRFDRGDFGWVAEDDGVAVGAAWALFLPHDDAGYGFVDERTPEVSVWVSAGHRRMGIGRALLQRLRATASSRQIATLSLSVEPDNHARNLYLSEGYIPVAGREDDGVMVKHSHTCEAHI
ncbi:hypothetical protein BCR15_07540 [Tessaracoccus lapidicaptus]|uniref:Uncharacterized protein n=1 Tax=Tessaracoccus lapidicaptus TaxID=1427523 RepID=A0A1C0AIG1_9ACTN|nr:MULTISPECIES: GNAT family N-acetyltransferase [Tessaracoccus]AQX15620.1 N-acetyltransferase [Tessaracoccus sp. T2.5-30]OCL31902.1 hypothetical protein BCR15_07540 [Tessaracoccus lapidicaptus]VEP39993.1 hypothetical protein TLA_TLA_01339 [Tessaracoccus lapidicaptus]